MNLVLLDVDGTLCDTFSVDGECYLEALRKSFSLVDVENDWNQYPHVTDTGILNHLFLTRLGRLPDMAEVSRMKNTFFHLLQQAFETTPELCVEIPGAISFVNWLHAQRIPYAVATGGWRRTAQLKLHAAGFNELPCPIASSNESEKRIEICRAAVNLSCNFYGQTFPEVVYIGDGKWDESASEELSYTFVGISARRESFGSYAKLVLPDFSEPTSLQQLLIGE